VDFAAFYFTESIFPEDNITVEKSAGNYYFSGGSTCDTLTWKFRRNICGFSWGSSWCLSCGFILFIFPN